MNHNIQIFLEIIEKNSITLLNDYSQFSKRGFKSGRLHSHRCKHSYKAKMDNNRVHFSQKELLGAGRICPIDIMDRLTAQAYYNPQIIGVINLLLGSEPGLTDDEDNVIEMVLRQLNVKANVLVHIVIPKKFVSKTYKELFLHLVMNKNMIALGLYRWTDQTRRFAEQRIALHLRQPGARRAAHPQ